MDTYGFESYVHLGTVLGIGDLFSAVALPHSTGGHKTKVPATRTVQQWCKQSHRQWEL